MALNSHNVPGGDMKMWNSYKVPADHDPQHILEWTAVVARGAPGGKLHALIINCHGIMKKHEDPRAEFGRVFKGGYGLSLGTGILQEHLGLFGVLNPKDGSPLVADIYITACAIAKVADPRNRGQAGDGELFCSTMAKMAGANVFASAVVQTPDFFSPGPGKIDGYEGKVYKWDKYGTKTLTNL